MAGVGAAPQISAETTTRPPDILDDTGARITLPAPARRIITLYAPLSEALVALGCEEALIGRTATDDHAPQALPVIGTHMRPNAELIASLRPDLVVQPASRGEAAHSAVVLPGIPVARFHVESFTDLYACIARLGALTGKTTEGEQLVGRLKLRLAAVEKRLAGLSRRPRVFFEVRYPNLLGAGGNSLITEIITRAGGENCLADAPQKFVRLSEEALLAHNPDIYIVQQGPMNKNPLPPQGRPHFRTLRAVQSDAVFIVDESLFSRPGPSSVTAVERLAEYILLWDARANLIPPSEK